MVKIFYPATKKIQLFSNFDFNTQSIKNNFPSCSISLYDDSRFKFIRQSFNDEQVLSLIPSDDSFSFSSLEQSEKNKYILGKNTEYKIFYVKIIINKNVELDEINDLSSFYTLSVTKIFGLPSTKYYPVTCVEKNQFYTVYRSSLSFYESDFIQYSDSKIIFNMIGDYDVELNYPIEITATNSSYTPISQSSSASTKIISQSENTLQYFSVVDFDLLKSEYSSDTEFLFTAFNLPTNQNLFSTSSSILISSSNRLYIKYEFLEGTQEIHI